MTVPFHVRSTKPESEHLCFLYSESYPEGRIGYREWARRSGGLGDIHSVDDRYSHDIDELVG
jgi:hypothetical protein